MEEQPKLEEIDEKIDIMKITAQELESMAFRFPAIAMNIARIKASVKMLELNISDLAKL